MYIMHMKLKQKPSKFVWQHRENRICTQRTSVPVLDLAVIKGIETAMLASTPHQTVHTMVSPPLCLQDPPCPPPPRLGAATFFIRWACYLHYDH